MSLHPSHISLDTFRSILSRYQPLIDSLSSASAKPKPNPKPGPPQQTLAELDHYRLVELPKITEERKKRDGKCHLEKEEVEKLIRWKLKHGKFRPTLISLVLSNDPDSIKSCTNEAWKCLTAAQATPSSIKTNVLNGLICLTSLRGIGPASASLLLSVMDPEKVPFFSDEAYRWVMSAQTSSPSSSNPWNIKIKYNKAEYESYLEGVQELRETLGGVTACEVERVGFVLGKEDADLQGTEKDAKDIKEVRDVEEDADKEMVKKRPSKSTKRKSDANDEPPSKRSTRKA